MAHGGKRSDLLGHAYDAFDGQISQVDDADQIMGLLRIRILLQQINIKQSQQTDKRSIVSEVALEFLSPSGIPTYK